MANPVRVRFTSSLSSAQLRGVTGEPTDGITLQGTYQAAFAAFKFNVAVSGLYEKFEDPLGGSSYAQDTAWGTKQLLSDVLEGIDKKVFGQRHTQNYTDLYDCIKDEGDAAIAGSIYGEPGKTQAWEVTDETPIIIGGTIGIVSNTKLVFPTSYKVDYSKTGHAATPAGLLDSAVGATDIHISGGEFDGNAVNNGYMTEHDHGLILRDGERCRFENMYFHDWPGDCIYGGGWQDVVFKGCTFVNPTISPTPLIGRNGIAIVNSSDDTRPTKNVKFEGCTFEGGNPACADLEPDVSGNSINSIIFSHCTFRGDYRGIALSALASGTTIDSIIIEHCTFEDLNYGVEINGYSTNVKVIGSIFNNCTYGVVIFGDNTDHITLLSNSFISCEQGVHITGSHTNINIISNSFIDCSSWAIYAGSGAVDGLHIRNNDILNSSQLGDNSYSDIYINGSNDIEITNNTIISKATSPRSKYPLEILACDRVSEVGNKYYNHATADYAYHDGSCTEVFTADNVEDDELVSRSATLISPILRPVNASSRVFIETPADVGAYNDIVQISNNYVGGTLITFVLNKDTIAFYQNGIGYAKVYCGNIETIQKIIVGTEIEINGSLNHDGTTAGFLGVTPATQRSHVADAETNHSLAGASTVDIAALKVYMDSLGTKINSILSALETFGFHATS